MQARITREQQRQLIEMLRAGCSNLEAMDEFDIASATVDRYRYENKIPHPPGFLSRSIGKHA